MTIRLGTSCPNLNHRRGDAPVRYCPQCGGTVNSAHPIVACPADRHTAARRQQSVFCAYCGVRLIGTSTGVDTGRLKAASDGDDPWRY
jgi:rRNA maturation protein Nop10